MIIQMLVPDHEELMAPTADYGEGNYELIRIAKKIKNNTERSYSFESHYSAK